jgi:hypothetical protein
MQSEKDHNHLPRPDKLVADNYVDEMIERAEQTSEPPRTIISKIQKDMPLELATVIPSDRNLTQAIQRVRRNKYGKAPQSRSEIDFSGLESADGEPFLLDDSGEDDEDRVLVFGTQKNLKVLKQNLEWFIDGTFEVAPDIYKQLFTIQVVLNGFNLPLVYVT